MRLGLGIGLVCLLAAAPAPADAPAGEPAASEDETLSYDRAEDSRMTLPVSIDGRGPYRFIVDTGSERTVISRELAETLALDASDDVMLTSVFDVQQVPTVMISELGVGRRTIDSIQAPALSRHHIGAAGVLGIDALEDQQVLLDFENRELTLTRNRGEERTENGERVIVVRARTRLGRMVLADVRIDGARVYAIVDTGSPISMGNSVLRERLIRRGRVDPAQVFTVTSVTGTTLSVNFTIAERLRLGGVELTGLPVAFADSEVFRQLGLEDRPAMLLGMNALRAFDRVSIDFANRRLRLEIGAPGSPRNLVLASLGTD